MTTKRFRVLRDFAPDDLGGTQYVAGLTYTIREGNDKLATLADEWATEGLIEFLSDTAGTAPASAAGTGTVT